MAEITLHEYCEEAKELIRADSYDQAIAICRHILKQFPKHIVAYRLMGEASLEKGDYVEAANLFKRVLSADLENVVVYVGLGIVYDEEGALEEAIWELERAFELSPGNAEIRGELQRLYGRRDGTPPPKLKLTPAALARLYLREGLYERAIDELRGVLEEDPDRADIQSTLAEALWWSDQRREASEVCEEILEKFPNCLKASLILGEIFLNSDRGDEGRALIRTAQAMDPENLVAQDLFRDRSPLAFEPVYITKLEAAQIEGELEEISPREVPSPAAEAEQKEEATAPVSDTELEEAMPEWLRKLHEEEKQPTPDEEPAPTQAEKKPDWLQQLEEGMPGEEESAVVASDTAPQGLEEDMPSWVRELQGATEPPGPEEAAPPSGQEEGAPADEPPALEEREEEPSVGVPLEEAPSAREEEELEIAAEPEERTPDRVADESAPAGEMAVPTEPSEAMPEEEEPLETGAEEGVPTSEELPDWVRGLREEAVEGETVPDAEEEEEMPDWLRTLREEAAEPTLHEEEVAPEADQEMPGWLRELREEPEGEKVGTPAEAPAGTRPEAEEEKPSAEDVEIGEETMARLRETMPDESASIDEIMAWMERSKAMIDEGAPVAADRESLEEKAEAPSKEPEEVVPRAERAEEERAPSEEAEAPIDEVAKPTPGEEMPGPPAEAETPVGEVAEPIDEEEMPEWLRQLRAEAREEMPAPPAEAETPVGEVAEPADEEKMPDWVRELKAEARKEEVPAPPEDVEPPPDEAAVVAEGEEVPDWLQQLREEAPTEETRVPPDEREGPIEEPAEPVEEEIPVWLQQLKAEASRDEEAAAPEEVEAPTEEERPPIEAEVPTWLKDARAEAREEEEAILSSEQAETTVEEPPPLPEEQVPTWLRDLTGEAPTEEAVTPREEAEAPPEEPAAPSQQGEIPSWLLELRAEALEEEKVARREEAQAPPEEPAVPSEEEEEIPAWLRDLRAEALKEQMAAEKEARPPTEESEPVAGDEDIPQSLVEEPPLIEIVPVKEEAESAPAAPAKEAVESARAPEEVEESRAEPAETTWGVDDYLNHLASNPRDHEARLRLARTYLRDGDLDQATSHYKEIVSFGALHDEVVTDLEAAAGSAPDHLPTHELLADAYMKHGDLQKALDKYRWLRMKLAG